MEVTQAVRSGQEAFLMSFIAHGTFWDVDRDLSFPRVHGQPGKFDLAKLGQFTGPDRHRVVPLVTNPSTTNPARLVPPFAAVVRMSTVQ